MKKEIVILSLFILTAVFNAKAQGLQPGECGIRFTYDAAGNLIQREFICNNTGVVMNKVVPSETSKNDSVNSSNNKLIADDIVKVNAIMPNPTTGKFTVRLSKPLNNGNVMLLDMNGKVVQKSRQSGNNLTFDISSQPSATYLVRIECEGQAFTFKVIKQ